MQKCKICGYECPSQMGLTNHIRLTHKLTCKDYYDSYVKSSDCEGFCKTCGKPTRFQNIILGYKEACCIKCAMPLRAIRNIEKYGYPDNLHNPEIIKKAHSNEANIKRKNTMITRYGVESYTQTQEFKDKSQAFFKEHVQEIRNKANKTNIEKYGVECMFQRADVRDKINILSHSAEANEKRKKTTLERFGVESVLQLPEVQEKAQKNSHTPEAVAKIHRNRDYRQIAIKTSETKKKNGNKSTYELRFMSLCQQYKIEYIEEYSDNRYPYPCDFYLPEKDCFVEIHGSWVHGGHIYDKELDKKQYNDWKKKAKTSKYHKVALKTWTKKDPQKLETAKKNHLNYIILWTLDDINLWFSMDCPMNTTYSTYGWLP